MTFKQDGTFDITIEGAALSSEQVAEVDRFLNFIANNRVTLIEYLVCASTFRDCEVIPQKLKDLVFSDRNLLTLAGSTGVEMYIILDKYTGAFLSACASFRDRLFKRQGVKTGGAHPLFQASNMIYDASFEYRLFYNLRNVGLHYEAIFHNLPVTGDWLKEDAFNADLRMDRLALARAIKKSGGQKRVRDELLEAGPEIDFVDAARKYLFHMRNLFFVHLISQGEELIHFRNFFTAIEKGIRGAPEAALMVLFKDYEPPSIRSEDGSFSQKVNITHLSLDEADMLLGLFPELRVERGTGPNQA